MKGFIQTAFDTVYHPLFTDSDDIAQGSTNLFLTGAERTAIATNSGKETNATHFGDVAGDAELTIQANSVETAMLVASAVTTDKINNAAVTEPKIADGAVTAAKLAPGVGVGVMVLGWALSDEDTAIDATGVTTTDIIPLAFDAATVKCKLKNPSASAFTVMPKVGGFDVLNTNLTISGAATLGTSTDIHTSNFPGGTLPENGEITWHIISAGDNLATGLKGWILGTPG